MSALNGTQQQNLVTSLGNTAFGRLSQAEINAVLAAMTAAGYTPQAIGTTGVSVIASPGEFEILVNVLKNSSPASRLTHTEVFAALQMFLTLAYPILRPAALGVS